MTSERGFLARLSSEELQELDAGARRRRFPSGSTLFNEGESSNTVFFLRSGRVKLSYFTDEGLEVILGVRPEGEVLGELSAIDGGPRSATATALEEVEASVVSAERFRGLIESHPHLAVALLEIVAARLRDADRKRVEFGALDSIGRVARRLVELAEDFGTRVDEGVRIDIALSQQDLAGWTGSSREAVSKALQALRSKGLIETHRRAITILDPEGLRRRAR